MRANDNKSVNNELHQIVSCNNILPWWSILIYRTWTYAVATFSLFTLPGSSNHFTTRFCYFIPSDVQVDSFSHRKNEPFTYSNPIHSTIYVFKYFKLLRLIKFVADGFKRLAKIVYELSDKIYFLFVLTLKC